MDNLKYISGIEKKALKNAIENLPHEVYLFGSRVHRKGGDIDIIIMAKNMDESDRFKLSTRVTVDFQKICDQKIDIVVFDPNNLTKENESFLELIDMQKIDTKL